MNLGGSAVLAAVVSLPQGGIRFNTYLVSASP